MLNLLNPLSMAHRLTKHLHLFTREGQRTATHSIILRVSRMEPPISRGLWLAQTQRWT